MLTVKRLYLYTVLGISLALSLLGLKTLLRVTLQSLGDLVGIHSFVSGDLVATDLSWALALCVVAIPIWAIHVALARRLTRGHPAEAADERACASRSTYFLLVLAGAGLVALIDLFELSRQLTLWVTLDQRPWGLADPLAGSIVFGVAWLAHLLARGADLRAAPVLAAGDWGTRLYVYGALFLLAVLASVGAGNLLAVLARMLLDLVPAWQRASWWQEEIAWPLSLGVVATLVWLSHWFVAGRLVAWPPPLGASHRASHVRSGYFMAVVATGASVALVLVSLSLRHALAAVVGTGYARSGAAVLEEVGGPLLLAVPFVVIWWWHLRHGTAEAFAFGGPERGRAVRRAGRLVVALIGLTGLSAGIAWELQAVLDALAASGQLAIFSGGRSADDATAALAVALVGLAMWAPAWAMCQRDRARDVVAVATAAARRVYLFLVSGVALVALMGSLAFLVYQLSRLLMSAELVDDASWAPAVVAVAACVLGYHGYCLRADLAVSRAVETPAAEPGARVIETIEISAPAGADFKVLNAAIRTELPEGYELRVIHEV